MNWISVEDRLPEIDLEVLIVEKDLIIEVGSYQEYYWVENTEYKMRENVTHWMPIPKPPKS